MVAIFVTWFNFCWVHETLRCTPAMEAGLASRVWSVEDLVMEALEAEPCEAPSPEPLKARPEAPKVTEKQTSTGARLRVTDGGKAPQRRAMRPGEQATIWTVLREARRQEDERDKPPPDTPEGGATC
jgi:hypothetical protein